MKRLSWKAVLTIVVILAAVVYVLPTVKPGLWPHKKINLGLDLQGGMHLVLEVQAQKAVDSTIERIGQEIQESFRKEQIRSSGVKHLEKAVLEIEIRGDESVDKFRELLDKDFRELRIVSETRDQGNLKIRLDLPDEDQKNIRQMAVRQALETIRNRVDQFGVSEPDIRAQGERRILIQLPGIRDTQRAKDLIGRTALLEFKLVDEENDPQAAEKGSVPSGSELVYKVEEDPATNRVTKTPFLLKQRSLMTGAHLTDAKVQIDSQYNEPYVGIDFDRKGARIFERVTGENVQKRLAIVLDNKVYSAPVIQERISGGSARITGSFTMEEARDLAIVLRAGALPAPVDIIEERTVGPSLGADSIRMGLVSMMVGFVIVVIFMLIYYKASGIAADFALILNVLFIAAGLAAFQATLTLPGIAGIILTIGMAVDANVLIFERIREELGLGKTPRAALEAGYSRATLTIMDANVTTLIAALVLFQFGTGAVKGFAVTLSLGVISSLFTALILTRAVFDAYMRGRNVKTMSI